MRDGGQQLLAVGEVAVARARGDADRARGLAQREALDAALGDERQRRPDEAVAEVAVVIGRARRDHHAASMLTPFTQRC